jgi:hypothetical protein
MINLLQKNFTFFSPSNTITKSINRVGIHIVSLDLLDEMLGVKVHKIPHYYGGYIYQLKYSSRKVAHLSFKP